MSKNTIPWWKTKFGAAEIDSVSHSIREGNISQGKVTAQFENKIEKLLDVPHVIATTSGSAALAMALMAIGIKRGDEVIIPNRGWIATAHAVWLLGANPIFADVEKDRPVIKIAGLSKLFTRKTKAIVPVHLNGRAVEMASLLKLARMHGLFVIEDAAQAFLSRNERGALGTQGDIGCFSLSVAKLISTGQGGFLATSDQHLADRLRLIRTQGVGNVKEPGTWGIPGFNFRITDIQASIGLEQLRKVRQRVKKLLDIHQLYQEGLHECANARYLSVDQERGEIPIYSEILCRDRQSLMSKLGASGIETRVFLPNLSRANYFTPVDRKFKNSDMFENLGLTLPSGPAQRLSDIQKVIERIRE